MILDTVIIAVLMAIAILLLILELFFLPGLSIAGFVSILFYGVALYYAFSRIGIVAGVIALAVAVILTMLVIWYFMRSRTLDKVSLHAHIDSTAPTLVSDKVHVGDTGVTLSRLNPIGRVLVGDVTVEARSLDYIDEGVAVRIMKVESTNVVVELIEK